MQSAETIKQWQQQVEQQLV
jgi:hypothetical protein